MEIKVTIEQVQRMLAILGNAPYVEVADIIDSIKLQANQQLKSNNEAPSDRVVLPYKEVET